ncbi:hypothetical protein [Poseidonocella sp. HB161398]|uniref:hypothetical protein n=1 Tax=Poseidonocella sp. HB161398 TaxID=2320855 RepID=UPI001108934A|nr:hypothetical protein [Poseidonocella sp. HB161398]
MTTTFHLTVDELTALAVEALARKHGFDAVSANAHLEISTDGTRAEVTSATITMSPTKEGKADAD